MGVSVKQRNSSDCAIAAIAMALSISYEEVLVAAGDEYQIGRAPAAFRLS